MSNVTAATTATLGAGTAPKAPQNLTVSEVFGQATWLMTQSRGHRTMFLSDLEWMLMPAILLRQFRLFPGKDQPLGIALMAQLSDEASERLETSGKIKPEDWKSGDNLWLVELVAPFGQQEAMLGDLRATVFKGKQFKMYATDNTGQRQVVTMSGDGAEPESTDTGNDAGTLADAPADKTIN